MIPPARDAPVDRRRFHAVVALLGVAFGMTAPLTAIYAKSLGAGDAAAGLAVASVSVSLLLVDVFGTRFVPRIDARLALTAALALFGAGSFVSALAPAYAWMVGARVLQGFGGALFMGGGLQLAARLAAPGEEGAAIGSFNAAWFTGIAAGPLLGGSIASVGSGNAGLRLAFAACGLINMLAIAVVRVLLPSLPTARTPELGLPRLGPLGGLRGAGALALGGFGQAVRGGVALTLLPLFGHHLGLSTLWVGVALSVLAFTDVTTMRVGGSLVDRTGRFPVLASSLLWGAVVAAVAGSAVHGLGPYVVICLAFGVTVGATWSVPPVMILDVADDGEAGLAAYRMAADVGMILGSTGAGVAVARAGAAGSMVWVAGALALAALVAAAVGETRPSVPDIPLLPESLTMIPEVQP